MLDVSVVIPARNAERLLPSALGAVARQRFAGEVEVIVVDDRSTDGTRDVALASGATVLRTSAHGGPGEARNIGARASSAPLLAFTDADCVPTEGWLDRGVAALRAGADLVQGRVQPAAGVPVGPFDRTIWVDRLSPWWEAANLFVTRDAFDRAGGFPPIGAGDPIDRRLRIGPDEKSIGEDTLFGWAVKRAGGRVAFAPEAVVQHAVFPQTASQYVGQRWRMRFFPHLLREVPELRTHLVGGVFLSQRTLAFDVALIGAAATVAWRRPGFLLLSAPYVHATYRPWEPRRRRLTALAVNVCADTVGLVSLVRGTVTSRTVAL